jgi:hypothetical protein
MRFFYLHQHALIFTPEVEYSATMMTNQASANCTFNTDYSELFLTADDYLLRLKLK